MKLSLGLTDVIDFPLNSPNFPLILFLFLQVILDNLARGSNRGIFVNENLREFANVLLSIQACY